MHDADRLTPKRAEAQLQALIQKYGLEKKLTVSLVKRWVYSEQGDTMDGVHRYTKKCLSYFRAESNLDELNRIMQIFSDAWNAFPHKSLGGKSPIQKAQEYRPDHSASTSEIGKDMPDMIVGGEKMPWGEYWAMIREMERRQIPFRRWIEHEALPTYKKYLKSVATPDRRERQHQVAEVFFTRALHVGFLDMDAIRKDFVQKEFPRWWPTHVLDSDLKAQQVRRSLHGLFQFLELVFQIDPQRFGFRSGKRYRAP